jgi:hypothetical protein
MGNAYALKIKKINDNNLLKDVVFGQGGKILEYVHFITKINKYYIENFRKNTVINDFTIYNVFTKKENQIFIERVESGYFFEGLEYNLEPIPNIEKFLFISNVIEDGICKKFGVHSNSTILLGNEEKYFNSIKNVEEEVEKLNAKFIFYDYIEEKIIKIDFEDYRNMSNSELRMGFECEERYLNEINLIKNIQKENLDSSIKSNIPVGEENKYIENKDPKENNSNDIPFYHVNKNEENNFNNITPATERENTGILIDNINEKESEISNPSPPNRKLNILESEEDVNFLPKIDINKINNINDFNNLNTESEDGRKIRSTSCKINNKINLSMNNYIGKGNNSHNNYFTDNGEITMFNEEGKLNSDNINKNYAKTKSENFYLDKQHKILNENSKNILTNKINISNN